MEEKKKSNVEDIVNKLRQPAIITDRKSIKSNKAFNQLPISVFHCNKDECKPPTNSLKTFSLLSVVDKCEATENGDKVIFKNFNFDEVKDSSTQTSKTIIQLAKLEAGEMSPDSLSPTPRTCKHDYCNANFENFTLDGSNTECNSYSFCRKNNIEQYLQNLGEPEQDTKDISYQGNSALSDYPKKSLIETYLEKSRHRLNSNMAKLYEQTAGDMIKYRHVNSPTHKVHDEEASTLPVKHSFKSQSLIDDYNQHFLPQENDRVPPQYTRFTVRNIHERNHINITYRDTIYERNRNFPGKRSNSFMLPTLSSEQKSKMDEVRAIKKLISPTRRGRSTSPNPNMPVSNRVEIFRHEPDKIPYIDQSKSEIINPQTVPMKEKKSISDRAKTSSKIVPVVPANNFQRDMMRIDQMSLTLLPSDDSLSARSRGIDADSLYSTEVSLTDVLTRIQATDWNTSLKALADVTELCKSVDAEMMMPHMITINQRLIELLRSPRSHVCRTACQAAGHLFESMRDTRGPEFNDIVDILLGKTADANKFIRQDANLALDCMVTHITTFHAVRAVCGKGPTHKNHLVRCATVRLLICAVVIAGPDMILNPASNEHTRKRIFNNMIRFLEDKNLETRKYGERLYKVLSKEPNFDQYLRKYMDKEDLVRMKKTLKFLSGRK